MESCLQQIAFEYLDTNRKYLHRISDESGVGYWWIQKFLQGRIKSPGVDKIEAILRHGEMITRCDAAA